MNNNQLMILLVLFVMGYFANQMMENMCGNNLVEGSETKKTVWQ